MNEAALKIHRSKGRCRRHYLTPRSSKAVQSSAPSFPGEASPCPASSPTASHAADSQPSCVQPSGLADQPAQPAAPKAGCQLQPVGPNSALRQPSSSRTPVLCMPAQAHRLWLLLGPSRSCLGRRAGCYTHRQSSQQRHSNAVLKVVSSPNFDPFEHVRSKRAAAADPYLDAIGEQVCGQLSSWQGLKLVSCAR